MKKTKNLAHSLVRKIQTRFTSKGILRCCRPSVIWNETNKFSKISSKQSRSADPCTFGQKDILCTQGPSSCYCFQTPPGHSHVIHSYCYSTVYICVMSCNTHV